MITGRITINAEREKVLKLNSMWWLSFKRPLTGWVRFNGRLRNGTMRIGPC